MSMFFFFSFFSFFFVFSFSFINISDIFSVSFNILNNSWHILSLFNKFSFSVFSTVWIISIFNSSIGEGFFTFFGKTKLTNCSSSFFSSWTAFNALDTIKALSLTSLSSSFKQFSINDIIIFLKCFSLKPISPKAEIALALTMGVSNIIWL